MKVTCKIHTHTHIHTAWIHHPFNDGLNEKLVTKRQWILIYTLMLVINIHKYMF